MRKALSLACSLIALAGTQTSCFAQAGGLFAWGETLGGTLYQAQPGGPYLENPPIYGAYISNASGLDFSVAVRPGGRVMSWGGGWAAAYGIVPVPNALASLKAVKVYAGFDHAIALLDNDTIYGWGGSAYGQSGRPLPCNLCLQLPATVLDPSTNQQVPVRFHTVSAGEWINIGILKHIDPITKMPGFLDRTLIVWGKNEWNRLQVPPGLQYTKFKQAVCGGHHVLVLDIDGNVSSWGYYYYPIPPWDPGAPETTQIDTQYGPNFHNRNPTNSNTLPYFVPNYLPGAYGAIAAGHHVDYGFRKDGKGKLTGEVDVFSKSNPLHGAGRIPAGNGERWEEVSAGYYQGMGIKRNIPNTVNNGKLVGWYNNGDPPTYMGTIAPFPTPPDEAAQQPGMYWNLGPSNSAYHHTALAGCYANCDGSTTSPALTANDFICFMNEFACGSKLSIAEQIVSYVNCDGSTTPPILTAADFTCFNAAFAAGECKPGHTMRPVECAPCCPR